MLHKFHYEVEAAPCDEVDKFVDLLRLEEEYREEAERKNKRKHKRKGRR